MPPATRSSSNRSARARPAADRPPARRRPRFPTYGPLAVAWIAANVVHGPGDKFGQPFECTADQCQFLDRLLRYDPSTGRLIVRRALLGRAKGWGKTEFLAAIALFFLAGPLAPLAPDIPVAAGSFEQADLLFGTARSMVSSGPLKPYLDVFDVELLLKGQPGRMYRIAAEAGTNDGSRPTLFIADELHEWVNRKARVFLVVSNSIAKRQDGIVLAISTAGSDDSELLRQLYDYGQRVQAGEVDDDGFLMDWAEASAKDDPSRGPAVRRRMAIAANPHAEQFGLLEHIERRWHEIPEHEWRRYFANQWVKVAAESWLPAGQWETCRREGVRVDRDSAFVATVDMALKHDTASVRAVQRQGEVFVTESWAFVPPDGGTVDVAAIEQRLRDLHRSGNLTSTAYDPAFFERSAQALADEGLVMVEFPQSNSRMVPACQDAYRAIMAHQVVHDDGPVAAAQVTAAVPKPAGEGWRLSKGRTKHRIDAAITLVMGIAEAQAPVEFPSYVY